jgi:hypothetical protein
MHERLSVFDYGNQSTVGCLLNFLFHMETIKRTVEVHAPVSDFYAQWTRFEAFPDGNAHRRHPW